jgi:hypothetical protein
MANQRDAFQKLLEQLGNTTEPIAFSSLYALSDLAGTRLAEFCTAWSTYPADRRGDLARALVELAEATFSVNFDAIFRHCLDDPSAAVRTAAVDGLWEDERTDLIGPFLTMLRADPSTQVRAAAATGLGRFVLAGELDELDAPIQERIMTELLTTIHSAEEPAEVRRRAIESAAYASTTEVQDAIELAYYDDDEKMRISAVVGMGRSCDMRWKSIILRELTNDSRAMRFQAAWTSGELMLREAVPILAQLIHDPDRQICNATIWALGQIGGSQAKQILISFYRAADEDIRIAIDEALAELALAEGDLEFPLYNFDKLDKHDWPDDESFPLWIEEEEEDWDL